MKIVDRKTFMQLPTGTMFQKYTPEICEELCIKDSNLLDIDFWYYCIDGIHAVDGDDDVQVSDMLYQAERDGQSFNSDLRVVSRDGCFDQDQLFLIWEPADVAKLVDLITNRCQ